MFEFFKNKFPNFRNWSSKFSKLNYQFFEIEFNFFLQILIRSKILTEFHKTKSDKHLIKCQICRAIMRKFMKLILIPLKFNDFFLRSQLIPLRFNLHNMLRCQNFLLYKHFIQLYVIHCDLICPRLSISIFFTRGFSKNIPKTPEWVGTLEYFHIF